MAAEKKKKKNSKIADKLSSIITVMMLVLTVALSAFFIFVDFEAMELSTFQYILIFVAVLILIAAIVAVLTNELVRVLVAKPIDKMLDAFRSGEDDVKVSAEMEGIKNVLIEQREEIKQRDETVRAVIDERDTDSVTGLLTRPAFIARAADVMKNAQGGEYSVLCVDIDHFGEINAKFGYEMGDMVLRRIGTNIRLEQEKPEWLACRDRADRFYMLKPTEKASSGKIASMEDLVDRTMPIDDVQYHVGGCIIDDVNVDFVYYMDSARAAVKQAKNEFGKEIKWFDSATKKKTDREQTIINSSDAAISGKQFLPCFQPKYDYESGEMIGAEALVRWNHPELGMVSPGEFIPVFERTGFITKLGDYMLKSVCEQISKWKKAGLKTVPVSINLSRREIAESDLAEKLHATVSGCGLDASDIRFEVTEQAYNDTPEKLKTLVKKLHEYGYKVELDNYGSGYMSAKTLMDLPVDMLKIDGGIVNSLENNEKREAVMSMLIRTAQLMGVPGMAQGVESDEVAQLLKEMGCTMMQGYLFAKPLFAEEFEKLLAK